ncbi:MAG: ABC transporter substrate-binding protein [Burkholderiales bacterium]|nr:ABC transporter substrate-binding protein [Burkholderiales bacterium]
MYALTRFLLTAFVAAGLAAPALAQDKVTFMTSWYAQAEHGGFYQALARGIYKRHGMDVTIRMGGPQVNNLQLLLAGQADFIMSYDFAALGGIEKGFPVVTVGASFQKDLQGMLTHDDVRSLGDLKGKTILVASSGRSTWWPWLKAKYGYGEEQTRPYTFNLQPFFADRGIAQQAYPSSEPFQAQQRGVKANFFLFADDGYPPYGTTIVTTHKHVADKPDLVARFVRASIEGWKSYMAEPAAANELIRKDNPNMTPEQLEFALRRLKELKVFDGGDAATMGAGIITEARWRQTFDYMVRAGLLQPGTDWRRAFTTQFVRDLKIMP